MAVRKNRQNNLTIMIPYGKHHISANDIDEVIKVLNSDWLTQGSAVPAFEDSLCNYTGAKYAVAVNSGTSALHLACLAFGVSKGDVVWTSPNTFVASANCAIYCGASVDFIDVDQNTANMSEWSLETKLEQAKEKDTLPKVVIPVHFAGQACDMQKIKLLSDEYGFKIIEDAAHAIGGSYKNSAIGSCEYSDATIFSFHPVKNITSGEGGAILTNNKAMADKLSRLRSHGITKDVSLLENAVHGDWYYEQIELGFNFRMTDIHAALGNSQMARLKEFTIARTRLAQRYDDAFANTEIKPLVQMPDRDSAWHLYVIRFPKSANKGEVFSRLKAKGIGVQVHYIPVHLQPYYRHLGFKLGDYPNAEAYYDSAITIPLYPGLTEKQQDFIVNSIKEVL